MELEKYELIELIGNGSYGQVYRAREKATHNIIAVKLIKKKPNPSERERKDQKKFLKECKIHSSLGHPNIIRMLDSFEIIDYIVVVTELAGIDLHRFMSHKKLSEKHVQRLTWHLLSALYYLHSQRVSHRDLKPQNILLNNYHKLDEMNAKLCDFGLARKMTPETYLLTSVKGTPLYMAPEVMDEALYDERADLWSVGCIIYEAHFNKPPIKTSSFSELMKWLRFPEIVWPTPISSDSKSFLQGLLKKEPRERFTWHQILDHPYVKDKLLILANSKSERPLTEDLPTSQQIRKDKQRKEIILHRGQKKITDAMIKCQAKGKIKPNAQDIAREANLHRKPSNVIGDNESISSDDSVNAIIQTDLETDVKGPLVKKNNVPRENSENQNQNLVVKRYTDNFPKVEDEREDLENANLKIGTLLENIEQMQLEDESKLCAAQANPSTVVPPVEDEKVLIPETISVKNVTEKNTDLAKRKLSHNLENFSIRLGNEPNTSSDKTGDENNEENAKDKSNVEINQSVRESGPEGSDNKKDTYEDEQSPPIENVEWLAFIHISMQELLSGETDSLKHQNLLGIIVAILRNFNATIRSVYVQTKLLPNLIFASKIVCMVKGNNPSFSSTMSSSNFGAFGSNQDQISFRKMNDFSIDELKTLASIYELICYLIHSDYDFVGQFCDSVYIIANDLLRHLLSDGMQIVCATVSTLCFVLRETPENAEIIESIIFHESVDLNVLVNNGNVILRSRLCNLLKTISRFSCFALQKAWTKDLELTLEGLLDDGNVKVKDAAKDAIEEISRLSFYGK